MVRRGRGRNTGAVTGTCCIHVHVHSLPLPFSGEGTWCDWEDGYPSRYTGRWLDNFEHGPGRIEQYMRGLDGRVSIEGTFVQGLLEGEGKWTHADGRWQGRIFYQGCLQGGNFQQGQMNLFDEGIAYRGQFEDPTSFAGTLNGRLAVQLGARS